MHIHIESIGHGDPVLLMHGMPRAPGFMEDIGARLAAAGYRALVAHMPGYGQSPATEGPVDLAAQNAALATALDGLDVPRDVAAVGYSGGTYRLMAMTLAGQLRPRATVLAAPQPGFTEEEAAAFAGLAGAIAAGAITGADLAPRYHSPAWWQASGGDTAMLDASLAAVDPAWMAAELQALASSPRLLDRASELRGPTLVWAAEHDCVTALATSRALATAMPDAELEVVLGAGHMVAGEDPARFASAIVRFLDAERLRSAA